MRQTGFARDAIAFFEARHPKSKLNDKECEQRAMPRKHFDDFCTGDPKHGKVAEVDECGDADAVPLARAAAEGLKRAAGRRRSPRRSNPTLTLTLTLTPPSLTLTLTLLTLTLLTPNP